MLNQRNLSDSRSSESSESLESSDDEIKVPPLSYIQSSKDVQKQIERSIAKLSRKQLEGNKIPHKLKSKRQGGGGGCRGYSPEKGSLAP